MGSVCTTLKRLRLLSRLHGGRAAPTATPQTRGAQAGGDLPSLLDRGLGAESEGLAWAFELGTRGERMSHSLCPAFRPSQGLPGNRAHGLGPASGSPRWLMTLSLYFLGHLG